MPLYCLLHSSLRVGYCVSPSKNYIYRGARYSRLVNSHLNFLIPSLFSGGFTQIFSLKTKPLTKCFIFVILFVEIFWGVAYATSFLISDKQRSMKSPTRAFIDFSEETA